MNSLFKYLLDIDLLSCTKEYKVIFKRIAKNNNLLQSKYYCYVMDCLTLVLPRCQYYKIAEIEKILCHKRLLLLDNYPIIIERIFNKSSEFLTTFYELIDDPVLMNLVSYNKIVTTASKFKDQKSLSVFKNICKRYIELTVFEKKIVKLKTISI